MTGRLPRKCGSIRSLDGGDGRISYLRGRVLQETYVADGVSVHETKRRARTFKPGRRNAFDKLARRYNRFATASGSEPEFVDCGGDLQVLRRVVDAVRSRSYSSLVDGSVRFSEMLVEEYLRRHGACTSNDQFDYQECVEGRPSSKLARWSDFARDRTFFIDVFGGGQTGEVHGPEGVDTNRLVLSDGDSNRRTVHFASLLPFQYQRRRGSVYIRPSKRVQPLDDRLQIYYARNRDSRGRVARPNSGKIDRDAKYSDEMRDVVLSMTVPAMKVDRDQRDAALLSEMGLFPGVSRIFFRVTRVRASKQRVAFAGKFLGHVLINEPNKRRRETKWGVLASTVGFPDCDQRSGLGPEPRSDVGFRLVSHLKKRTPRRR